jgi:hypothetical protein
MDAQAGANTPGWLHQPATQFGQASTDVLEKKMTRKFSDEALAWLDNYHGSYDSTALLLAYEAGMASGGAAHLKRAADEWSADPESWGDNDKDYRNELRDRADDLLTRS